MRMSWCAIFEQYIYTTLEEKMEHTRDFQQENTKNTYLKSSSDELLFKVDKIIKAHHVFLEYRFLKIVYSAEMILQELFFFSLTNHQYFGGYNLKDHKRLLYL